jgi:hypothetical protein
MVIGLGRLPTFLFIGKGCSLQTLTKANVQKQLDACMNRNGCDFSVKKIYLQNMYINETISWKLEVGWRTKQVK